MCLPESGEQLYIKAINNNKNLTESRRVQEDGGELDSHEEASPEEIKSREVVLGYRERELDVFCFSCFPTAELRTLPLCIAVGTEIAWCGGRCAMPDGHCLNILLF